MRTGKQLFLADKPLTEWWVAMSHHPNFERVSALVDSHLFHAGLTAEQMKGAEMALGLLATFSDSEDAPTNIIPAPGLIHTSAQPPAVKPNP